MTQHAIPEHRNLSNIAVRTSDLVIFSLRSCVRPIISYWHAESHSNLSLILPCPSLLSACVSFCQHSESIVLWRLLFHTASLLCVSYELILTFLTFCSNFSSYLFPVLYFRPSLFPVSFLSVSADTLNHGISPSVSPRFRSCTLQSAAVGARVARVAAPPPPVVAVPQVVPVGSDARVPLGAVCLR